MSLSASDLAWIRQFVGSTPDDAELNTIYATQGSRAGTARYVLRVRRADFASQAAKLDVDGELSQDTTANLKALDSALQDPDLYEDTPDEADEPGALTIVLPEGRVRLPKGVPDR